MPEQANNPARKPQQLQGPANAAGDEQGWVLYDGDCGICGRWVPRWAMTLRSIGLGTSPLQAGWVSRQCAIPETQLLEDVHLVMRDGRVIRGADVYRYILRRLWWAWPLWAISVLPGFRQLFDAAYQAFAARRYRISAACHLPPVKAPPGTR